MRIPLEVIQSKKANAFTPSLSEDHSQAISALLPLSASAFCQALPSAQTFLKQALPLSLLHPLYDKLDEALEQNIEVRQVLQAIANLIQIKANRSLFRSLDRLLYLFKHSEDMAVIQISLAIIIHFFKTREILQK